MKNAEDVTFGGSNVDRAAHLRISADTVVNDPSARTIILWRGRLLINNQGQLVKIGLDHGLLKDSSSRIFLGLQSGKPTFASDISNWAPETVDGSNDRDAHITQEPVHPDAPDDSGFYDIKSIMARLSCDDAELAISAKGIFSWHHAHNFCAKCGNPTIIDDAGWRRSCQNCQAQHFPRTDPVVIMLITSGNSVLVGRSPGWPEKTYSLLAGFMEPGETIEAAVRRETLEESNIKVGKVGYLASQPWPFPSSLMIGCWGYALTNEISIDKNELENALWVSKEDIIECMSGLNDDINMARKGSIAQFLIENWIKGCIE